MSFDTNFKEAFQFSSFAAKEVSEICIPLSSLGIKFFRFLRVYYDYSYLTLMNGYDNFLKNYYDNVEDLGRIWGPNACYARNNTKPHYLLWPSSAPKFDLNMQLFFDSGIRNGISLLYRSKDSVDIVSYAFCNNTNHTTANNFFINNRSFLEKFTIHFQERAQHLINPVQRQAFAKFPKIFDLHYKDNPLFKDAKRLYDLFEFKKIITNEQGKIIELTKREAECLELIAFGETMKGAACTLNISPRTVEQHINSIKAKSRSCYKSDLVRLYFNVNS
ncbi:MAG: helix-turn-helix transcriptional regulator [Rickettsiales bacterium]